MEIALGLGVNFGWDSINLIVGPTKSKRESSHYGCSLKQLISSLTVHKLVNKIWQNILLISL